MTGKKKILVPVIVVLLLVSGVFAFNNGNLIGDANATTTAPAPTPANNLVHVQGEGVVRVVPDVAYVTLGVETTNKDVSIAQTTNKDLMNGITGELTKLGIAKSEIQTQNYSISPDYRWENDKNTLVGYRVTNLVRVKIVNIDNTGKILDAIAAKGSNIVQGIQFTVADEKKAYNDALQIALKNAEDKAKVMAGYFGITKLTPVMITEGAQNITYPPIGLRRPAEMETATPISPGEMEVRAQVSVSFEY